MKQLHNIAITVTAILSILLQPLPAQAKNIILMLGDGMGTQHLICAEKLRPLYLKSLPIAGKVHTRSYDNVITDSAASATAYACGQKTKNYYLGKLPNGTDCQTIAEKAIEKGLFVGIYSTDMSTGASPSAFYAHVTHRNNAPLIQKQKETASQKMDILVPSGRLSDIVEIKLNELNSKGKPFFAFFEEAYIDKESHNNNYQKMLSALYDFDLAIHKAVDFASKTKDTTVVVLADHETGGLTKECRYTTKNHTGTDISLYAFGPDAKLFQGEKDNTQIYKAMHSILFKE